MDRIPTNYNKIKDLEIIDSEDLLQIELSSKVLSLAECFEYLMLEEDDLNERELEICKRVHRRGLKKGIHQAADNLFGQMKSRGGTDACINYLKAFSGTFVLETNPAPGTAAGFNFNVILPADEDGTVKPIPPTANPTPTEPANPANPLDDIANGAH